MGERSEKLMSDVKVLVSDAGGLVRASTMEASDRLAQLEAAAAEKARVAAEKARAAAQATDDYVHVHPWTAIGISAGIGLILGVLIGRR
jgi:ElaB/YqjD/DUF883 family membrane-anchored ribosome-binding protein